jgi:hypothetical protein
MIIIVNMFLLCLSMKETIHTDRQAENKKIYIFYGIFKHEEQEIEEKRKLTV